MINLAGFLGQPIVINDILLYPPLIKDMASEEYPKFVQVLTMSQEDIEDSIEENRKKREKEGIILPDSEKKIIPTPFEVLISSSYHDKEYEEVVKKAFYFFLRKEITFLYEEGLIYAGNLEEEIKEVTDIKQLKFISSENFFEFQNTIRQLLGQKPIKPPDPNEHPKVKELKAKARYRDRVKNKTGKGISIETSVAAICCMGLGITPLNVGEMSYLAMMQIISMYQQKESYEIDIKSLLAGGDSKKIKPKYWIRNIEE